jgi:hypothetical protein
VTGRPAGVVWIQGVGRSCEGRAALSPCGPGPFTGCQTDAGQVECGPQMS